MAESDIEKDRFLAEHADFRFREQVCYPNGGISRFYDNGIDLDGTSLKGTYFYRVTAVSSDDMESNASEIIKIDYK